MRGKLESHQLSFAICIRGLQTTPVSAVKGTLFVVELQILGALISGAVCWGYISCSGLPSSIPVRAIFFLHSISLLKFCSLLHNAKNYIIADLQR